MLLNIYVYIHNIYIQKLDFINIHLINFSR